jgi:hypothetical protein
VAANGITEVAMDDNRGSTGWLALVVAGIVAIGALVFILTGGDWGGKTKVEGDADLPPVITSNK